MIRAIALVLLMAGWVDAGMWQDARWEVRDVKTGRNDGLKLETGSQAGEIWKLDAEVADQTQGERAVTVSVAIQLNGDGRVWWDDPQKSRKVEGEEKFSNEIDVGCGQNGKASLYPIAVVSQGDEVVVMAVPVEPARMVRFELRGRELRAEFDLGLSDVAGKLKEKVSVIGFVVHSRWPFRAAMERYWNIYQEAFARRDGIAGGIWLPFGDMRAIAHAEDFGFAAHECADGQVSGDDAKAFIEADRKAGAGTFPYVEPPTYWQQYLGDPKAGYVERLKQLETEAEKGSAIARGTLVSGIIREDGKRDLYLEPVPYTTQAPWGSDANPLIPANDKGWVSKGKYEENRLEDLLEKNPGLAGVYIDSMEGWGTILDYDKKHWQASRQPLTFDTRAKKVCLWNFWGTYTFAQELSQRLHANHQLLMANDAYFHFWYACPFTDLPGREYTWVDKAGRMTPVDDEHYLFFKSMSGRKPYMMLMNNAYDDVRVMEPYFQRSLFWGVYPSMFQAHLSMSEVAYFSNPTWYERDRPLFKKYIPLIRKLEIAGWRPVPQATISPAAMRMERYGEAAKENLAYTVYNPTTEDQDVSIEMDVVTLGLTGKLHGEEWISGKAAAVDGSIVKISVPAQGYAAVGIKDDRFTP